MDKKLRLKTIRRSHRKDKKWDAVFELPDGKTKTVPFGAKKLVDGVWEPMSDFTKHKDETRKQRYIKRHSGMGENWNDPTTPGALSLYVLWNKPTFKASVDDFKKKFDL